MSRAAPGHVLRLAVIGWGLGRLALGERRSGLTWLAAEVASLVALAVLTALLAGTTWYLLPFLLGCAVLVVWAVQAVASYRRAQTAMAATPPTPRGSPAAFITWLCVPTLLWGTGFWLLAGSGGSPSAVLDRFTAAWPGVVAERQQWAPGLATDPAALSAATRQAVARLERLCAAGSLAPDCGEAPETLLRDVRLRIVSANSARATALAELVTYERVPARVLGLFETAELVAVPSETLLRIEMASLPSAFGSRRWRIVNVRAHS